MTIITLYDPDIKQEVLVRVNHATMRKTPDGEYCFSLRVFAIDKFDIKKLKDWAKEINLLEAR